MLVIHEATDLNGAPGRNRTGDVNLSVTGFKPVAFQPASPLALFFGLPLGNSSTIGPPAFTFVYTNFTTEALETQVRFVTCLESLYYLGY